MIEMTSSMLRDEMISKNEMTLKDEMISYVHIVMVKMVDLT